MTERSIKSHETAKSIRRAILRIKKGRTKVVSKSRKMSIASVAEECGLSRASIHKDYPELVDIIKAEAGKNVRAQRDHKNEELKIERQKNRDLRSELTEVKKSNQKLASINASLTIEILELRAIAENSNVSAFKKKPPK